MVEAPVVARRALHHRLLAAAGTIALVLAAQVVMAPPAWACHFLSTTPATPVPGGFTFEAQATTTGNGNTDWAYEITSSNPSGLTPSVTWSVIDAYPDGSTTGGADPSSHAAGEGMRFFVSGLSSGDEVTVRVITFTGVDGDCTGDMTSRRTSDVTGTVTEDAPTPSVPAAPATPPTLVCDPAPASPGASVTCTVSRGDPGIAILWVASAGGEVARAGVTLDDDGRGSFSFVLPAGASAGHLDVELVEWNVSAAVPIVAVPAPTVVPNQVAAGGGAARRPVSLIGVVALLSTVAAAGALSRRRPSSVGA